MIVGSASHHTLRRQAEEENGAHSTAGPDHHRGSSDPMFPTPLHARPPDALRLQGRSVSSTTAAHVAVALVIGLETEAEPVWENLWSPEGRSPERSEGEWAISMSAFHPKADMGYNMSDVRNVP